MGEQVLDSDGGLGVSYFTGFTIYDFEIGKFRNKSFNRVIKFYHSIFHEGHDSHANNRFGHGVDSEDSVFVNWGTAIGPLHTHSL